MKRKVKKYIKDQFELMYHRDPEQEENQFNEIKETLGLRPTNVGMVMKKKQNKIRILCGAIGVYTLLLIAICVNCVQTKIYYNKTANNLYNNSLTEADDFFTDQGYMYKIYPNLTLFSRSVVMNFYEVIGENEIKCFYQIYFENTNQLIHKLECALDTETWTLDDITGNRIGIIEFSKININDKIVLSLFRENVLLFSSSYQIV